MIIKGYGFFFLFNHKQVYCGCLKSYAFFFSMKTYMYIVGNVSSTHNIHFNGEKQKYSTENIRF